MRLGIDVDDTITNTYECVIKEIAEYYKIDYNELLNRNLTYTNFFDNDEFPKYDYFVVDKFSDISTKVSVKADAVEFLSKLHDEGNEIVIITARHSGEYNDPYDITFNYLNKNNIPFDKIIVGALDKAKVCKDENIDLFIDDSITNCKKVIESGIDTLLFNARFNSESDLKRVYSWKDVYDLVNKSND